MHLLRHLAQKFFKLWKQRALVCILGLEIVNDRVDFVLITIRIKNGFSEYLGVYIRSPRSQG